MAPPTDTSDLAADQLSSLLSRFTALLQHLANAAPPSAGPLRITWERFALDTSDGVAVIFDNLQIGGPLFAGASFAADLRLSFADGAFQPATSYYRRRSAQNPTPQPIGLDNVVVGDDFVAATWPEPEIGYWLRGVLPNLFDQSAEAATKVAFQIVLGNPGEPLIAEVRLDWPSPAPDPPQQPVARSFALPGLTVSVPQGARYSLVLSDPLSASARLALVATLTSTEAITARTRFAWGRDGERELHNDEKPQDALFELSLSPKKADEVSLVLLDVALGAPKLPTFFRQLATPLAALSLPEDAAAAPRSALATVALQGGQWNATLKANFGDKNHPFTLPFLKQHIITQNVCAAQSCARMGDGRAVGFAQALAARRVADGCRCSLGGRGVWRSRFGRRAPHSPSGTTRQCAGRSTLLLAARRQ